MDVTTRLLGSNGQYSRCPLDFFLAEMGRLGLSRLDFVPQTPHLWFGHTGYEDTVRLKAALDKAELRVTALTPPAYRCSITAPAGIQREATLRHYRNSIALARELGADRVVLGAAGACWDLGAAELWQNAREMLIRLCPLAEQAGVKLLLCPVMGPDTPLIAEAPLLGKADEIARMLSEVGHPSLGAALDTNVMSTWGDTIPRWFDLLGDRIGLVRLTDGNYHGWRAWGDGCLPMSRYRAQLEKAGYRGNLSLLLPGERYIEHPQYPDDKFLRAQR